MGYEDNQIANGMKWNGLLTKWKALQIQKEFEWIESQPSIMKDIEVYLSSIKKEEQPKKKAKGE